MPLVILSNDDIFGVSSTTSEFRPSPPFFFWKESDSKYLIESICDHGQVEHDRSNHIDWIYCFHIGSGCVPVHQNWWIVSRADAKLSSFGSLPSLSYPITRNATWKSTWTERQQKENLSGCKADLGHRWWYILEETTTRRMYALLSLRRLCSTDGRLNLSAYESISHYSLSSSIWRPFWNQKTRLPTWSLLFGYGI